MNKVSGRILNVEAKPYEYQGKTIDKWDVSVQVGNETKKYQCGDKRIADKSGQDIEFTVVENKNKSYPDYLNLPKEEISGKSNWRGGGKPSFVDNGPTTAWDTILMVAKDLYIAGKLVDSKQFVTFQQKQFKMYQEMVVGKHEETKAEEKKENAPVTEGEIPF